MRTSQLTGQDLAYWVARANMSGSAQEANVLRKHYGDGPSKHGPSVESSMQAFVSATLGEELPPRETWQ